MVGPGARAGSGTLVGLGEFHPLWFSITVHVFPDLLSFLWVKFIVDFFNPDLSKRVQLQGTGAVSEKHLLGFEFDRGGSDHTNC